MTMSDQIGVLRELRNKQQHVWSSGDYNKIAAITVPVAEHLVEVAAVSPRGARARRGHRHGPRRARGGPRARPWSAASTTYPP